MGTLNVGIGASSSGIGATNMGHTFGDYSFTTSIKVNSDGTTIKRLFTYKPKDSNVSVSGVLNIKIYHRTKILITALAVIAVAAWKTGPASVLILKHAFRWLVEILRLPPPVKV